MRDFVKLKRTIRRVVGLPSKAAVVLMYHRVADIASTPYHGIVSIKNFTQQMEYIHNRCYCISLPILAEAVNNNSIPRKSVVITFDDGYSDNYLMAYPILENFLLPATIFITSCYVSNDKEYWWDELERLVILPETMPDFVPFTLGDRTVNLNFSRFTKDQRILLLTGIHGFLKSCRSGDRETILSALRILSGIGEKGREDYLPMSLDQITSLSNSGLIDIGAHTMTHPVLSALSREEQYEEITGSIRMLEKIIGKPVNTFSYPFGSARDFNSISLEIIRSTNVKTAVTTIPGVVRQNSDLAALPRVWVGNWDLETFRKNIDPFFL